MAQIHFVFRNLRKKDLIMQILPRKEIIFQVSHKSLSIVILPLEWTSGLVRFGRTRIHLTTQVKAFPRYRFLNLLNIM